MTTSKKGGINARIRAAIWKLKKLEKKTNPSQLWIMIKREIIIYGLVPQVTTCLILNKLPLRPENSCNKKDSNSGQEHFVLTKYFDFCSKF